MVRQLKMAAAVTVFAVAGLLVPALSSGASAVTVPNMFACTRSTGHCFQTNGTYRSDLPRECWWTNRTGSYDLYYTLCTGWEATPRGY
jgi:hypothetical protein